MSHIMNSNRAFKINVYRIVSKIFKYGMQEMTFVLGALPLLTATGKSRKFNNIKGKKKKNEFSNVLLFKRMFF